jgi:hypothetical protein
MFRCRVLLLIGLAGCSTPVPYRSAPEARLPSAGQEVDLRGAYFQDMGWGYLELVLHDHGQFEALNHDGCVDATSRRRGRWSQLGNVLALTDEDTASGEIPGLPLYYEILLLNNRPILLHELSRESFRRHGVSPSSCLQRSGPPAGGPLPPPGD